MKQEAYRLNTVMLQRISGNVLRRSTKLNKNPPLFALDLEVSANGRIDIYGVTWEKWDSGKVSVVRTLQPSKLRWIETSRTIPITTVTVPVGTWRVLRQVVFQE